MIVRSNISRSSIIKFVISAILIVFFVLTVIPQEGILVYVSQDNVNNLFLKVISPLSEISNINIIEKEKLAEKLNYIVKKSLTGNYTKKVIVVDHVSDEYLNKFESITTALKGYDFEEQDLWDLIGYKISQIVLIAIFLALVIKYFRERKMYMTVYLSILPAGIVPAKYFPLLFTSIFVIVTLGSRIYRSQTIRRTYKELREVSKEPFDYVVLVSVVLALIALIRVETSYVIILTRLIGAGILTGILILFNISQAYRNLSLVGLVGSILSFILKSSMVGYYYGLDFGFRILMIILGSWLIDHSRGIMKIVNGTGLFIIAYV